MLRKNSNKLLRITTNAIFIPLDTTIQLIKGSVKFISILTNSKNIKDEYRKKQDNNEKSFILLFLPMCYICSQLFLFCVMPLSFIFQLSGFLMPYLCLCLADLILSSQQLVNLIEKLPTREKNKQTATEIAKKIIGMIFHTNETEIYLKSLALDMEYIVAYTSQPQPHTASLHHPEPHLPRGAPLRGAYEAALLPVGPHAYLVGRDLSHLVTETAKKLGCQPRRSLES